LQAQNLKIPDLFKLSVARFTSSCDINRLELVKNIMHNVYYLNFYVQVPVACFSSLVWLFLNIVYVWGFLLFSVVFSRYVLGFYFITEWQHW